MLCDQTGRDNQWTEVVDVPAGGSVTASGTLVAVVNVTLETDAKIDTIAYKAGTVAKLKGRLQVQAGGVTKFITFTSPCHLRTKPELDCYP